MLEQTGNVERGNNGNPRKLPGPIGAILRFFTGEPAPGSSCQTLIAKGLGCKGYRAWQRVEGAQLQSRETDRKNHERTVADMFAAATERAKAISQPADEPRRTT